MNKQLTIAGILLGIFLIGYFLPVSNKDVDNAIIEAFKMLQWYARCHTLACVVPAIMIAGAIATFLDKAVIMKYLGPQASPVQAYGVSSVSGLILAVCSCSVLPMFAGIYRIGAGLGPATTFLFSGPALNVMAIFLSARVLGWELGIARTVLSIVGAILVGLAMAFIFRRSEKMRAATIMMLPDPVDTGRPLWKTGLALLTMIMFLVFSDWVNPGTSIITIPQGETVLRMEQRDYTPVLVKDEIRLDVSVLQQTTGDVNVQINEVLSDGAAADSFVPGSKFNVQLKQISSWESNVQESYQWALTIYQTRWYYALGMLVLLLIMFWRWFTRDELKEWLSQSWSFGKSIIPLLFGGIFITGFVSSLIPAEYVVKLVGSNTLISNVIASLIGTLWYFATLTEIPTMQALLELGMHKGPALTLLIAGPTLSLPSIVVIGRYLGFVKTSVFVLLVVVLSSISGFLFGLI